MIVCLSAVLCPDPQLRAANCIEAGLPADFRDPLTARFPGVSGGNPDLGVETAETVTIGGVFRPSFVPRLSLTVDYWDVSLDDAIGSLTSQQIVNNCFDLSTFPNDFCALFTRNTDPSSPQFNGLTFVETNELNFRPKLSGNATVSYRRGPFQAAVQGSYQSRQALRGAEIETIESTFGPTNGFSDESYIFDANASYEWSDNFTVYGGVNNFTGEDPFITETAFPSSPRGRYFFGGVRVTY